MAYAGFDTIDDFVKEYLFILHCRKGVTARRLRRYILANNRVNMNALWPEMRDHLKTAIKDGVVTRKRENGGPARYKLCLSVRLSMMSEESKAMRERKIERRKLKKQVGMGETEHQKMEGGGEEEETEDEESEEQEEEEEEKVAPKTPAPPSSRPTVLKPARSRKVLEKTFKSKSRKEEEEEAEYVPEEGEEEEEEDEVRSRPSTSRGMGRRSKIERRKAMRQAKKEEERKKEEQQKLELLKKEHQKEEQQRKKPTDIHKSSVPSTSGRPKVVPRKGIVSKRLEKPEEKQEHKVLKHKRPASITNPAADPSKQRRKSYYQ